LSGGTEPQARKLCDLWAIGGALRADEAIAHFGACGKAVAAVTGLMPDAAQDQRGNLALDRLVQSRWLHDTEPDRGMSGAKAIESGAAKLETRMDADRHDHGDTVRLQPCGRVGNGAEGVAHRDDIILRRGCQHELLVQSLEQEKAETILQGLDLLTDGTWCHMQLVSGELKAEMARRGLEGAQRIERRQEIGPGCASCPSATAWDQPDNTLISASSVKAATVPAERLGSGHLNAWAGARTNQPFWRDGVENLLQARGIWRS
jgi:hypothetical protein